LFTKPVKQYGANKVLKMNYVNYSKPDTRKGELMNQDKPLIDYVNNHKRCDDDIKLAGKLAFASKVVGVACLGGALWTVIWILALNAVGA
jgi:hypothetical protein